MGQKHSTPIRQSDAGVDADAVPADAAMDVDAAPVDPAMDADVACTAMHVDTDAGAMVKDVNLARYHFNFCVAVPET